MNQMPKCKFEVGSHTKGGAFGSKEGTAAAKRMKAHYAEHHPGMARKKKATMRKSLGLVESPGDMGFCPYCGHKM